MPHAVEGYFKNGGTGADCPRVVTATKAFLDLSDQAADADTALRL